MQGTSSSNGLNAATTTAVKLPIYDFAEEKLRELVAKGNLEAIALAMKLAPSHIEANT